MPRVDRQSIRVLDPTNQRGQVAEIELWIDALTHQIQRERNDIDVSRPLSVAEERPFDTIGPRQHPELRSGHAATAVVMRMDADDRRVPVRQHSTKEFDRIRIYIRRRDFDRRRQVQNHRTSGIGLEHIHHRLTDLDRKIEFGRRITLGRILEANILIRPCKGLRLHELRSIDCDRLDARPILPEDDASLERRCRVVEVNDRCRRALDCLEGSPNQVFAALREDLNRDVLRDSIFIDQPTNEIELRRRGARKADLDLLEPDCHQRLEEADLALPTHRLDERLIAVAQIDAAPARRPLEHAIGPHPIGQFEADEGAIAVMGHHIRPSTRRAAARSPGLGSRYSRIHLSLQAPRRPTRRKGLRLIRLGFFLLIPQKADSRTTKPLRPIRREGLRRLGTVSAQRTLDPARPHKEQKRK